MTFPPGLRSGDGIENVSKLRLPVCGLLRKGTDLQSATESLPPYLDDVFLIQTGSETMLHEFDSFTNTENNHLQFTLLSDTNKMNFLNFLLSNKTIAVKPICTKNPQTETVDSMVNLTTPPLSKTASKCPS